MAVAEVVSSGESRRTRAWGSVVEAWRDGTFPSEPPAGGTGGWYGLLAGWGAYSLILLLAMRSLVLAPEGSWIGGGELEGWLWRYWWMKELVTGAWMGSGPLYGLYVLLVSGSYPEFGNLLDLQVLSWPLERVLGAPDYLNAKIFLILWLDCAACWFFLSGLWGRSAGTWLGGLLFGLNSYFVYEISNGRLRQAVAFTIPLFMFYLYRCWRQGGVRPTVVAGSLLGLTAAFYHYYGMFLGFFCFLSMVWHAFLGRHQVHARGMPARMAGILAVGLLVAAPFAAFYLEEAFGPNVLEVAPYGTAFPTLEELTTEYGTVRPANLLAGSQRRFVRESLPLDALWRPLLPHALPLAGLVLAFLPWKYPRRIPWLWLGAFLGFLVLSFGPYFSLGESSRVFLAGVPTPYLLLYRWVPLFSRLFAPARLEVMVFLALAVLVCLRVHDLARTRRDLALVAVVVTTLGLGLQMELAAVLPFPTVRLAVAPYYHLLGDQPPMGLIEVPFRTGDYLEYNQTVHRQKVLGSFAQGGVPPGYPSGYQAWLAGKHADPGNSFLTHLEALNRDPARPLAYRRDDLEALVQDGYRLLILHERGCYYLDRDYGDLIYFKLLAYFRKTLGEPLVYTDEPVHSGLEGRQRAEDRDPAWYRMAVFSLTPREDRPAAARNLPAR